MTLGVILSVVGHPEVSSMLFFSPLLFFEVRTADNTNYREYRFLLKPSVGENYGNLM
jgi:hypothetical protein